MKHPVSKVLWIPLDKVEANDYNPNQVARNEMILLYHSIKADGFTQPIVTIYDKERDKYVIVDGFHRYLVIKTYADIRKATDGLVPIVVIDKPLTERMASTIRHNRARGKHSVVGLSNVVFQLLDMGWDDKRICDELGMEVDELIRMKYVTGFAKLFEDTKYSRAWETRHQIENRRNFEEVHHGNH